MPDETLSRIKPRGYQKQIYEICKDNNCLVILPTGIGKTLIALMLAINRQKKFPGSKIVFLAPTRPLAEQHLEYFKKYLPELFADLQLFTGKVNAKKRREIWQTADIIFSTPQCVGNDLKKYLYDLEEVSLLIEDECHRCLKNYSYTYVVEKYKQQAKNQRVLGLTASPGADRTTIEKIAKNLNIEKIEIRTRESEDVKEYIQEAKIEIIKINFPPEFDKIRKNLKIIFDKKTNELKNRRLLFGPPTKKFLLETQARIMKSISSGNKHFNLLSGASACSQAIKLQHALELLETQTLSSFNEYMQDLFQQAREQKSKAVQNLVKQPEFNHAYIGLLELLAKKVEHPKLEILKNILKNSINENKKLKVIVFTQYRVTAVKIMNEIKDIPSIIPRVFIGQAIKEMRSGEKHGLSQKEQGKVIEEFKEGKINVLVATSIGEEGLDIPEVNAVIFYEPVPSAIRKIQRAGRTARLMEGKIITLVTLGTRDEAYYYAAIGKEKKMYSAVNAMKKDMDRISSKEVDDKFNEVKENQKKLF